MIVVAVYWTSPRKRGVRVAGTLVRDAQIPNVSLICVVTRRPSLPTVLVFDTFDAGLAVSGAIRRGSIGVLAADRVDRGVVGVVRVGRA